MNKPLSLKLTFTVFFILYQLNLKAQNYYRDTTKVIVVVVPWQNGPPAPAKNSTTGNTENTNASGYISSVTPVKSTPSVSYTTFPSTAKKNSSGEYIDTITFVKTTAYPKPSTFQNNGANSSNINNTFLQDKSTVIKPAVSLPNNGISPANKSNLVSSSQDKSTSIKTTGLTQNPGVASSNVSTPLPQGKALSVKPIPSTQNTGTNTTYPTPFISQNKTTIPSPAVSAQNTTSAKIIVQQPKRDTVYIKKRDTIFIKQAPAHIANRDLFLEVGGPGLAISLNYDKRFSKDNRDGWGFRIGTGYFGDGGNTVFTIPFQVNYLIGNGSNFFELGAGTTFLNSTGDNTGKTFIFDRVTGFIGTATMGYRYQPEVSNLNFRIGFVPIFSDEGITPAGGISIGYTL